MGGAPGGIPFSGPPYGRTTVRGTHNRAPVPDGDVGEAVPRWRAIPHEFRELCQLAVSKVTPNFVKKRFPSNKYLCGPRQ
jgi:hypothetical protein